MFCCCLFCFVYILTWKVKIFPTRPLLLIHPLLWSITFMHSARPAGNSHLSCLTPPSTIGIFLLNTHFKGSPIFSFLGSLGEFIKAQTLGPTCTSLWFWCHSLRSNILLILWLFFHTSRTSHWRTPFSLPYLIDPSSLFSCCWLL